MKEVLAGTQKDFSVNMELYGMKENIQHIIKI